MQSLPSQQPAKFIHVSVEDSSSSRKPLSDSTNRQSHAVSHDVGKNTWAWRESTAAYSVPGCENPGLRPLPSGQRSAPPKFNSSVKNSSISGALESILSPLRAVTPCLSSTGQDIKFRVEEARRGDIPSTFIRPALKELIKRIPPSPPSPVALVPETSHQESKAIEEREKAFNTMSPISVHQTPDGTSSRALSSRSLRNKSESSQSKNAIEQKDSLDTADRLSSRNTVKPDSEFDQYEQQNYYDSKNAKAEVQEQVLQEYGSMSKQLVKESSPTPHRLGTPSYSRSPPKFQTDRMEHFGTADAGLEEQALSRNETVSQNRAIGEKPLIGTENSPSESVSSEWIVRSWSSQTPDSGQGASDPGRAAETADRKELSALLRRHISLAKSQEIFIQHLRIRLGEAEKDLIGVRGELVRVRGDLWTAEEELLQIKGGQLFEGRKFTSSWLNTVGNVEDDDECES